MQPSTLSLSRAGNWSQRIHNRNEIISTSPFDSTRLTLGLGTGKRFIISFGQTGFLESSHQTNSSIYYPFQLIWLYWFTVGKLDWLGRIHHRLHWFRPGKTALIYSIDRRLQMYWEAAQRATGGCMIDNSIQFKEFDWSAHGGHLILEKKSIGALMGGSRNSSSI